MANWLDSSWFDAYLASLIARRDDRLSGPLTERRVSGPPNHGWAATKPRVGGPPNFVWAWDLLLFQQLVDFFAEADEIVQLEIDDAVPDISDGVQFFQALNHHIPHYPAGNFCFAHPL